MFQPSFAGGLCYYPWEVEMHARERNGLASGKGTMGWVALGGWGKWWSVVVGTVWAGNGGGDAEVLVRMGVGVRVLEIEDEDILEMTRFVMRINGLLRKLGVLR
ncbi:hypothetical protein Acr_00g0025270 [Actinidia rufa]|uniref:Uncharacterized protein n=1 Tax=Actinidia rufa TaxID=165716 RepID=A0A7J0DDY8_9ERIC|nr:hypothetical protein Acr_00g0025270 [Actinidia rufa]